MVVASSWGKDSVALCDIAIETLGRVPIMHLGSPYGLPGYEEVTEHFRERTTVHVVESAMSLDEYIEWCRDIGLPHERTRGAQGRAVSQIKRSRGDEAVKALGFAVQALGLRASERGPRERLLRARGPTYQLLSGTWKTNPLAWWTTQDVWAYIVSRDLPYNRRIYDAETHELTRETIRNTGWLSTDGAHEGRIAWLRAHFPEQYRTLACAFPEIWRLV